MAAGGRRWSCTPLCTLYETGKPVRRLVMGRVRRFASLAVLLLTSVALLLTVPAQLRSAAEARLVRYPDYHAGRIAFTYLGDIWTADDTGQNLRRITANKARDVYPHFSPDGKWIAFSSD